MGKKREKLLPVEKESLQIFFSTQKFNMKNGLVLVGSVTNGCP